MDEVYSRPFTPEKLRPGIVFYLYGRKCHFVGTLQDGPETLCVYWRYNRYSKQRVYITKPRHLFAIELQYAKRKAPGHHSNDI